MDDLNIEEKIIDTINRFSGVIRHIILKNLYNSDNIDIEDIEQEVKIRIFKFFRKGKKVDNLASYINRIAYTICIDELRKMRKQFSTHKMESQDKVYCLYKQIYDKGQDKVSPELIVQDKELRSFMAEAISSLSQNRQQVLCLYANGFSIEEIGELCNWDKEKVRHLFYRGIDDMRNTFLKSKEPYNGHCRG